MDSLLALNTLRKGLHLELDNDIQLGSIRVQIEIILKSGWDHFGIIVE